MHKIYREVAFEDACRVLDYCYRNTIRNGGLFEVYSTPGTDIHMVIVNSCPEDGPLDQFRPLGAFYLNYLKPGSISFETSPAEEVSAPGADPSHTAAPRRHVAAIKQIVDILLKEGRPGIQIRFNDLPAVKAITP